MNQNAKLAEEMVQLAKSYNKKQNAYDVLPVRFCVCELRAEYKWVDRVSENKGIV